MDKGLNELALEIHNNARAHGFHEREINVGEKLMLIVSELAEALEIDRKETKIIQPFDFEKVEVWNDPIKFKRQFEKYIKDSFGDELADAIIRILDLAAAKNINIAKHVKLKMKYNSLREYKHGKNY